MAGLRTGKAKNKFLKTKNINYGMIANTPPPPYYAVIFSSLRTDVDEGYENTSERMFELASQQPGFLGVESARNELGLTVSYWESLEAIHNWKQNAEHTLARNAGREKWYTSFKTRICKVERDYFFEKELNSF